MHGSEGRGGSASQVSTNCKRHDLQPGSRRHGFHGAAFRRISQESIALLASEKRGHRSRGGALIWKLSFTAGCSRHSPPVQARLPDRSLDPAIISGASTHSRTTSALEPPPWGQRRDSWKGGLPHRKNLHLHTGAAAAVMETEIEVGSPKHIVKAPETIC